MEPVTATIDAHLGYLFTCILLLLFDPSLRFISAFYLLTHYASCTRTHGYIQIIPNSVRFDIPEGSILRLRGAWR